ncbi:MAG: hypothetical protein HY321_01955 [Armatimonadetes bacterium]|nr:hypothetical protein [Armatimonadota bacterium]
MPANRAGTPPARQERVVIALLGLHALLFLAISLKAVLTPHMVGPVEARVLNLARWWQAGALPYSDGGRLPALWNPYGPLYEGLCALLPSWPGHPYLWPRLLSLASAVGILGVVAMSVRRQTGSWRPGVVAALLLLTARPMLSYAPRCQVDALAAFLSVLGWALATQARSRAAAAAGVLSMGLAFHTKLTAVAALVACGVALWRADRRRALWVGTGWLAVAGGGFLWLQHATEGDYLAGALMGNAPASRGKAADMLTRPLTTSLAWIAAAIVMWRAAPAEARRVLRPHAWYLGFGLAVASLAAANPGSSWNFLLEPYIALAMLTGVLLGGAANGGAPRGWRSPGALITAHLLLALPCSARVAYKDWRAVTRHRPAFLAARVRLAPLAQAGGRVALYDSLAGTDALLSLGGRNPVDLPEELRPRSEALLRRALREGEIGAVLRGEGLVAWGSAE